MGKNLVDATLTALDEETVTVPGAIVADSVLSRLVDSLIAVLLQRKQVTEDASLTPRVAAFYRAVATKLRQL